MYNRLIYNLFLSLQPAFSYPPAILSLAFRHSCADFYRKLSKVKPHPHASCFAHPVRLVILFLSRIPCISAPVLKNAPCANMALGRLLSWMRQHTKIAKVECRDKRELVLSLAMPKQSYLRETKIANFQIFHAWDAIKFMRFSLSLFHEDRMRLNKSRQTSLPLLYSPFTIFVTLIN